MLQTQEARAEAASLMGVHANLCTPKNGDILVAATQVRTTAFTQRYFTSGYSAGNHRMEHALLGSNTLTCSPTRD